MNRIRQWMMGRNGMDQLGIFLMVVYFIVSLINVIVPSVVLLFLAYAIFIVWFYRVISRNIYKRQQENEKFKIVFRPVQSILNLWRRKFREKDVSRFYRCPKCKQTIRVPKGKGRIAIRCPKCGTEFVKRT